MNLKNFIIGASMAAILSGCGSSTPTTVTTTPVVIAPTPIQQPVSIYPNVLPSSPRWKLVPGSWTEYARYTCNGVSNPLTGVCTWDTTKEVADGYTMRVTDLPCTLPTDSTQVAIAHLVTAVGVKLLDASYQDNSRIIERQTITWLGEASNIDAAYIDPPEPYITVNPYVGEHFVTTHQIEGGGTLITEYWTRAVGPTTASTTLIERPGTPTARGYWYEFDGGISSVALGNINTDNTVALQILRRTAQGQN